MKYIPGMANWLRRLFSRKTAARRPTVEEILSPESKLEAFAAKFMAELPPDRIDARITEAFRLSRLWIAEVRAGEVKL